MAATEKQMMPFNLGGTTVNAEDVAGTNAYWQARNTEHGGDHKSEQARQVQGGATTLIEYGTNAYWQARILKRWRCFGMRC